SHSSRSDAIYARYSSHAQDDGTSIEVQIEQCERAADASCQHYIDRARTGRTMAGREQLLQLLADAAAGKIGRVFVYKFDRFGRDTDNRPRLRIDDDEAKIVRIIFGSYLKDGVGIKRIAQQLNANGTSTRNPERKNRMTRRLWSATTIKAMLNNPIYSGEVR